MELNRLVASAAKQALSPVGCKQIGRSRLWIADQRFWAIVIEFQASGFSKGSYLNVGACWLWHAKDYWSFDYGGRVEGVTRFQNPQQFAAVAEKFAMRAAEEVHALRKRFASLLDIAREISPPDGKHGLPVYHAAVAAGLIGDVAESKRLFKCLTREPTTNDWHRKLQTDGNDLAQLLSEGPSFQAAILKIIQQSRSLHRLPPDPTCLGAT